MNMKPDVLSTATELSSLKYNQNFEWSRLFPNAGYKPKSQPSFKIAWTGVIDNIQNCRKLLSNAEMDDLLEKAKESMTGVHDARRHDNAKVVLAAINDALAKEQVKWVSGCLECALLHAATPSAFSPTTIAMPSPCIVLHESDCLA